MLIGKLAFYGDVKGEPICALPDDLDPAQWWAYEAGRIMPSTEGVYEIRYDDEKQEKEKNALRAELVKCFGEFANDNKTCFLCWSNISRAWWALSFYDGYLTFSKHAIIIPACFDAGRVLEPSRVRHRKPNIKNR